MRWLHRMAVVVRLSITAGLLWMAHGETGLWTAASLGLLFLAVELSDLERRQLWKAQRDAIAFDLEWKLKELEHRYELALRERGQLIAERERLEAERIRRERVETRGVH